MSTLKTHNLGFPRIGAGRELKKAVEGYWNGKSTRPELLETAKALREENWRKQQTAGIEQIPSNDFSLYDQILDHICLLGCAPERYLGNGRVAGLDEYFAMARGGKLANGTPATALEMTKWLDTNYHYLVPELRADQDFQIASTKPFDEFREALALGIRTRPVLVGPVTFLRLSKPAGEAFDTLSLLPKLVPVYAQILQELRRLGAEWVQIDEPALGLDLNDAARDAFRDAYATLGSAAPGLSILLASYFSPYRDNRDVALSLPVQALHIDLFRAEEDFDALLDKLPQDKILSLGAVEGRNIWKNDFARSLAWIRKAVDRVGAARVWVGPSCSLLHSPVSLEPETALPRFKTADGGETGLRDWLSFAGEKLGEISTLARLAALDSSERLELDTAYVANQRDIRARRAHPGNNVQAVRDRLAAVRPENADRKSPFPLRQAAQRARLNLPAWPTTTIGSFPQTPEVRAARAKFKKGEIDAAAYDAFLKEETARCVAFQDSIGIDMPVHGEFERNDMVEYFGEQLEGFAFTRNGWVQSYGSRCVKPPVIYGDVSRPHAMTVYWSRYAQSLTKNPMKGMLTGPVTILQWSFVRDDQPRHETTRQIALAIRDEVVDLEAAGIAAIQIDEPAIREGLPLRRAEWKDYLERAVNAFRLSAAGVRDETQIHTHMCYSEFNDIIPSIAAMDADVITIETSRSNMELLGAFVDFKYPNEIGPGVWDIHSPRVPDSAEMGRLLEKARDVLPAENLWVNPDCGLKTRKWEEVEPALRKMVNAAKALRSQG